MTGELQNHIAEIMTLSLPNDVNDLMKGTVLKAQLMEILKNILVIKSHKRYLRYAPRKLVWRSS